MEGHDLKTVSQIGHALWADADRTRTMIRETFSATTLLKLDESRTLERTSLALLDRAERDGIQINDQALNQPFFRLLPEERFILVALHFGHWSYERLGRILNRTEDRIAQLAWSIRLHLSPLRAPHPTGSPHTSTGCPEYQTSDPWTQRFLDNELPQNERLFLQAHMMNCPHCHQALARCREIYYSVEKQLPRLSTEPQLRADQNELQSIWRATQREIHRQAGEFWPSLRIFLKRWDVRLALSIGFLTLGFRILRIILGK